VHHGRIIAERYADGFNKDTAHISQSMAKSVIAALAGILIGEGKLSREARAPVREWSDPDDPRHAITLDQLLRMNSGLVFKEAYDTGESDTNMQYRGGDYASYTAAKPLEAAPGTKFNYSTGTSNLIGRIVREAAGPKMSDGFAFPRKALFDPIGMRSAVLEVDAAGSLQGGSFVYASARDYARFGLLYLRDGVWNGVRILPEGWVAYTRTPTPTARLDKAYGVQFWLNTGTDPNVHRYPRVPADAYMMVGLYGQHTFIIPSHDLIVVRVGLSEYDNWDPSILVADVVATLSSPPS
jgi:CubicO group peptidase (beta-lactamase class C family)